MTSLSVKMASMAILAFWGINLPVPFVEGLDCFACHSINGSDRRCEDPMIRIYEGFMMPETCNLPANIVNEANNVDFKNGNNSSLGESEKGPSYSMETQALVPEDQTYCVKIIGTTVETKANIVIRTCIDHDLNSQCGMMTFKNQQIRGCMLTCKRNMCNGGPPRTEAVKGVILMAFLVAMNGLRML